MQWFDGFSVVMSQITPLPLKACTCFQNVASRYCYSYWHNQVCFLNVPIRNEKALARAHPATPQRNKDSVYKCTANVLQSENESESNSMRTYCIKL